MAHDRLQEVGRRLAPDGPPRDFHAKLVIEAVDQRVASAVAEVDRLERELAEETAR
jgi:hypothetical protein